MEYTTKEKIIHAADELFKMKGYEKTGIRDIAKACGISVSNLQYHFPKKVLIMAEVYNWKTSQYYEKQMQENDHNVSPIIKIMAIEYQFMQKALSREETRDSYFSSMMIPEVCSVYAEKSTELFISHNVCPNKTKFEILMANTIMYGGLSQVLQFYLQNQAQYELEELVYYPFKSRLCLLGIEESNEMMKKVHTYVKEIIK